MAHKHRYTTVAGTAGRVTRCSCGKRRGHVEIPVELVGIERRIARNHARHDSIYTPRRG